MLKPSLQWPPAKGTQSTSGDKARDMDDAFHMSTKPSWNRNGSVVLTRRPPSTRMAVSLRSSSRSHRDLTIQNNAIRVPIFSKPVS